MKVNDFRALEVYKRMFELQQEIFDLTKRFRLFFCLIIEGCIFNIVEWKTNMLEENMEVMLVDGW